ncbi:MAG: preprotein translocase subunit YajC [Micrococcales bacterium]|nr:preprotein translocase subunit YajC [Micrococcales bacterium]
MGTIATLATADAASSGSSGLLILALPLLLLAWMFWSSSRRQRRMRDFVSSLAVGDDVVTSSDMYGTIRHLDAESAYIEIAEGMVIRFDRRAVATKQPESTISVADDTTITDTDQ